MNPIERRLAKIEAQRGKSAPQPGFFAYEADAKLTHDEAEAMIRRAVPNARPGPLLIIPFIRKAPTGEPPTIEICDDTQSHDDWVLAQR